LKETTSKLWHYISETWARRAWKKWIGWAKSCKLEPMIRAAQMVEKHLDGIINAIMFPLGGLDMYPQKSLTHTNREAP